MNEWYSQALFLAKKAKSKDAAVRAIAKALADKQQEQKNWGRL